jgi:flagellar M-ring protein FliF
LRKQILELLSMVPGALVSVNVALDPEINRETRNVKFDKGGSVATRVDERTREETMQANGSAGAPGTRSNGATNEPATIAQTSGAGGNQRTESDSKQIVQPGGLESVSTTAGLTPKRVTVSVGIPKSYFEKIWRKTTGADESQKPDDNAVATIERDETQKLQGYIAAVLPIEAGVTDPVRAVTVKSFVDLPTEEIAEPTLGDQAIAWAGQYWSTLGMTVLGMFSLLMLRSIVRGGPTEAAAPSPTESAPPAMNVVAPPTEREEESKETAAKKRERILKRREGGPSLREELGELIKEDPDAAASILRSWIGSVN